MKQKLEVISKAVAEKLEAHAQVIHTLIAAQRRGAAEQFGYAFLAGRALLQAKAIVPNGNSRAPDAGFKNWVAANLPEITMRTAENWMLFAESVLSRAQVDACVSPLLLGAVEISGTAHDSILKLVPEIMDGRGMIRFMRDSRLLRVARRLRNKPVVTFSAVEISRQKNTRAVRAWERIFVSLEKATNILSDIQSDESLNRCLNLLMNASNEVRAAIKIHKVEPMKVRKTNSADGTQRKPPRQNHESAKGNAGEHIGRRASA
jgi:hypothetical protein